MNKDIATSKSFILHPGGNIGHANFNSSGSSWVRS